MQITTKVNFDGKETGYLLCGAFEGGCNYWLQSAKLLSSDIKPDPTKRVVWYGHDEIYEGKFSFQVGYDDPDSDEGEGNEAGRKIINYPEDIQKGLELMATKSPDHFADLLSESNADATTYDVAMQYIILGDCVYG